MKLAKIYMAVLLSCFVFVAQAQTASTQTKKSTTAGSTKSSQGQAGQISDDDLKKYAMTMDSVKGMQETLNKIIAENVQQNTVMSVERYNQLFKIEKDQAQLQAANATPEELAFLKDIAALRDYNVERINTAYQALAKEFVGLKAFNAIRKSVETDEQLKARYESITQELQSSRASAANEGE